MNHFIEHSADGRILVAVSALDAPPASFGGSVVAVAVPADPSRSVYVDGEVADIGPAPSWQHRIDPAARAWVLVLTDAEKVEAVRVRLQRVMDDAARALGYDDIKTAITYADEPAVPKFQAEAQRFRAWRSRVWGDCYAHPAFSGLAPIPTPDEAEALMPPLEMPGA